MSNKECSQVIIGGLATAANIIFGEWSPILTSLFILMFLDIVTGVINAAIIHKSKYGNGVSSKGLWEGAIRKGLALVIIVVATQMDSVLNLDFVRSSAITYLTVMEFISVVENLIKAGVPVPAFITKILDSEKKKVEVNE